MRKLRRATRARGTIRQHPLEFIGPKEASFCPLPMLPQTPRFQGVWLLPHSELDYLAGAGFTAHMV